MLVGGLVVLGEAVSVLGASSPGNAVSEVVSRYCVDCHDSDVAKGDLDLARLLGEGVEHHTDSWEGVLRKVRARQMPPVGKERPDDGTYSRLEAELSGALDAAAAANPSPGRTETFRRLNRTEYGNAIRDLLALEIDAMDLLPKDDAGHGFDNVTVGALSPTLLSRYLGAAGKISRWAVGAGLHAPGGETYRIRPDLTQEEHVEGLPIGTRGGAVWAHPFPQDGDYEVRVRLARDRNEEVEGLRGEHRMEVLLDGARVGTFEVAPPKDGRDFETVDAHLAVRFPVKAGPHRLGVTFVKQPKTLLETRRQPYDAHFNMHRHPRRTPAVYQVSIQGPYEAEGPGDTPSRRRIFFTRPEGPSDEEACAERIVGRLMRRAYRRPVTPADRVKPMEFYRESSANGGFEAGIEAALSAILVSPSFLFRIERDPAGVEPGTVYRLDDWTLASRLAFFLWSSLPDDELLDAAERGELTRPGVLESQARRMLADPRARNLAVNFAAQWLHLRNLDSFTPDQRLFPDFDDNLRQALRRETELHVLEVLEEDRGVLDLLRADHTWLNERLARHYGIPHVVGSRFRKVSLEDGRMRGGLLRQGGVLSVTSYATRTSPVLRGNWVLGILLGAAPPPPPADVPALQENTVSQSLPMRERLAAHRANSACAGCHNLMDPVGFSLENFDATGRWREAEDGVPIDPSGGLPDGSRFSGVAGLEDGLLKRPELFVGALTEKLLTFALGRGVEPGDAPAIRKILRDAEPERYRLSSLVVGIVRSAPFNLRRTTL